MVAKKLQNMENGKPAKRTTVNDERLQKSKITISKPLVTLRNPNSAVPVSYHFENGAQVTTQWTQPGVDTTRKTYFVLCVFMWVRSCTPRLLHFSLITLQLFFRVFKSTRKAGVRRSYMLPILVTTFFTVAIGQAQQIAPLGVDHEMSDKGKKKSQKRRKKMEKFRAARNEQNNHCLNCQKISCMNKWHNETIM